MPLYRRISTVPGEANCTRRPGYIAPARSDHDSAWQQASALYARIPEPYSIGWAQFRLVELADGTECAAHVATAREAWTSIDRPDLVALLDRFG